jgi:hypothetical protein
MTYWAKAPKNELAGEVTNQYTAYKKWLNDSGHGFKIQKSYDTYYGFSSQGAFGVDTGADGKSRIQVNHYKNLIQRLHNLCTQAKLNWQTRARNSDSKSQLQSDFAKGLLEWYQDERHLDKDLKEAVEMSLVMFEAFIYLPWDATKGESVRPDENGKVLMTGDQTTQVINPFQVARPRKTTSDPWYIIELHGNKHDLAALYPEFTDVILNAPSPDVSTLDNDHLSSPYNSNTMEDDDDTIAYYVFYHPRTPALPNGRQALIVGDVVVEDGPLQYQKVPVVRLAAGKVLNEVVGDSPASSLVSLQEALDRLFSAVTTNNLNGSVQNIYSSDPNTNIKKINEGMNLITGANPPQALSLVASSPETYKFIDSLIQNQQLLSGVNSTARGQPETNAKTAGGQSLMIAMAIQSISDLQASYATAASEMGTIIINNLQSFASQPMLAYIGGASRKAYVKSFTSEDIVEVDRVSVDLGNPILQTVGGRFDLIQEWTKMGILQDPVKAVEFLRTGQVDSLTEDKFKDSILIRSENEMLKKGEVPPVMVTDMHPAHILQHKEVLNDPDSRNDPNVTTATTQHLMDHIAAYKTIDPDLAAILGLQPLPSMQAGPAPQTSSPEVEGQNIPNTPQGTPPEIAQDFETTMNNILPKQ